jgi:hypothetical protein
VTVVLVRDSEDSSFGVGFIESSEGFLGSLRFFVAVSEEEQGGFFILEDFFNGAVVEGEDLSVNV